MRCEKIVVRRVKGGPADYFGKKVVIPRHTLVRLCKRECAQGLCWQHSRKELGG